MSHFETVPNGGPDTVNGLQCRPANARLGLTRAAPHTCYHGCVAFKSHSLVPTNCGGGCVCKRSSVVFSSFVCAVFPADQWYCKLSVAALHSSGLLYAFL